MVAAVENDDVARSSLRFSSEVEGCAIREFSGNGAFLDPADGTDIGCVIVGGKLLEMTGLELLHRLRVRGLRVRAITCVQLSGSAGSRAAEDARLLERPFPATGLVDSVFGFSA